MRVLVITAWTYWMALPVLVLTACTLLVFVWAYLKKVVEPRLLLEDQLREGVPRSPDALGGLRAGAGAGSQGRSR